MKREKKRNKGKKRKEMTKKVANDQEKRNKEEGRGTKKVGK